MKRLNITRTVLAAVLAAGVTLTAAAAAKTLTWTGAGSDANWSTAGNWDGAAVPTKADYAIIPESADGQPWQITIDKSTAKPLDFYMAGSTVFSGGFTLSAGVNGASGHGGVLSQGKMEVTGAGTAATFAGVTKTAPMKLASDASYLASEGGSMTFSFLCFDNSKDISFVASNQNTKVTLSSMWTNAGGTAQPNLNENNTGQFFGAYDGGLLTLTPDIKFVTGNDPTFIANGGKIVASKTQATTADAVLNVTSTNAGVVVLGALKGSTYEFCSGEGSIITNNGAVTGNPKVICNDKGTVRFMGAITGNPELGCSGRGTVMLANASGTLQKITGGAKLTCADEGSLIKTAGVGKAGEDTMITATNKGAIVVGATLGNVMVDAFAGATVELTSSMKSGNVTLRGADEGALVWVKDAITGDAVIDASTMATVQVVNATGTLKGITGNASVSVSGGGFVKAAAVTKDAALFATDEGSAISLTGIGVAGGSSTVTATEKGSITSGATKGSVSIAVDKGGEVKLTSTMATGDHAIACSNEDSVVWIQSTVTGNPVITCEDKGTVKLVKADDKTLVGVTGYPTVTCTGAGSTVTMGNLGATTAGVISLTAKDGATVTVGTTKFTIQAEASNGALLKMGAMTPSADNNEIVADNATIQFTGAMNGNKSFTSVYEVKGADGLIEGFKANLLFGSDAKTTVRLTPLRSRSSAVIRTSTSGDITFGAGVNYAVDLSDVSQDAFYGEKKFLIAESAGKLTFNAPTSVSVTGADPAFYSASLAAEGKQLYLTVTCTKVPEGMVAVVGVDEFYATLGEAVANVKDGGLISVMVDVAVAERIANPAGKTVTLNLYGNALTSALTDCVIDNAGTLVLKGAGTIASETAGALIVNRPTGVLTIEDGTYTCAKVLENQAQGEGLGAVAITAAVFNGTTENSGTLTVLGGTLGTLRNNGMLSVSGGTIAGDEHALYNCCTATVSGGTFDGVVACDGEAGVLEITGGAFKSRVEAKSDDATVMIVGQIGTGLNEATFAVDETEYCEEGFVTFKNGDVYIVRRATDVVITPVNSNAELGTLTVEGAGSQIGELGETLRGTITDVKAGYVPIILISGQRVTVADDGSFEGPAIESAEVVAAYAKADAWYFDPFVRNTFKLRGTYSPIGMIMDEDETFIAQNGDPGSDNYGLAGIRAETVRTSVNPNLKGVWDRGAGTDGKKSSYRQMAVSSYHQAVFGCPWYASDNAVYVVPFDPDKEVRVVGFDWGDMPDLSAEMYWGFALGDKIYYRSGNDGKIYRFSVVKDGDEITGLKSEGFVGKGASAPIGYKVNGVPYAYTWDGSSVQVVNLTDGSVTTNVIDGSMFSTARRTQITGVANGTPHLVLHGDGAIGIYALAPDMLHLVSATPVLMLDPSALIDGADAAFAGSTAFDDERTYVFCDRGGLFHIFEHQPAQLIVRGTFSDEANAEDDVLVDFGGAVEKTYSAPKDYMITAVKVNGVADSSFTDASYTYSNAALDTHAYVAITIEKRPVAQIGSTKYTELDAALAAAKAGDKVELLRDVEIGDAVALNTAMTLDLGGFKLTRAAGASGFMMTVDAAADIVNGEIDGGAAEAVKVLAAGELLLDNIKVTSAARTFFESHGKTTVGANAVITSAVDTLWVAEGVFNVYGTIENVGSSYPTLWIDNGELNFYDGSVLTSKAEDIVRSNDGSCQVSVHGGTFSCGNYPVFYFYRDSTATITIMGGQFESGLFNVIDAITVTPLDDTCTAKFKKDAGLAAHCASGFEPVEGEDGYYTIQKSVPDPADPEKPIPSDDPAGDAAKMNDADGTVKPECINAPFEMGADAKAAYAKLFTAVPGADSVMIKLNEDGTNAVANAEKSADTAALAAVLEATGDSATLEVETPLAGFFYSLRQSAAIESLDFKSDGDKNKLGGRDEISFTLDKPEPSGFYQVIVTPVPAK